MKVAVIGNGDSIRKALAQHFDVAVVVEEKPDPLLELTHMLYTQPFEPLVWYSPKKDRNRNDPPRNAFKKSRGSRGR